MSFKPEPIPEGYGTVTPWIVTGDTARVIEFIKAAFDGEGPGREAPALHNAHLRLASIAEAAYSARMSST